MSENAKNNSCLHCSVFSTKYQYQEIFDEFGIELGLQSLLSRHYQLEVSPDPRKQQLLCEVCVTNLIRLFDIDELERERNAGKDAAQGKDSKAEEDPIIITKVQATPPAAKPAKKTVPSRPLTKVLRPVPIIPTREPSARIRNRAAAASNVTPDTSRSPEPPETPSTEDAVSKSEPKLVSKVADQEHFSVLIQNILDEEEAVVEDETAVKEESSEAVQVTKETEAPGQIVILNSEAVTETNPDENVYIYEHEGLF